MCVVQIYQNYLLLNSPVISEMVDDLLYDGWDFDGGQ